MRRFCDFVSALIHLLNLRTLDAPEDQDGGSIFQKDRKFVPVAILSWRQLARFCKRAFEVGNRLGIGRAGSGAIAGTFVVKACLNGEPGPTVIKGPDFRPRL